MVAQQEQAIVDAGAQIIWVLEQGPKYEEGTAKACVETLTTLGATLGYCVGDDQTLPEKNVWDDSPFSLERGFDLIVDRKTMEITYVTTHGTPAGNENISGEEVLQAVKDAVSR